MIGIIIDVNDNNCEWPLHYEKLLSHFMSKLHHFFMNGYIDGKKYMLVTYFLKFMKE